MRRAQLDAVINGLPGGRVRGPDAWWVQNLDVARSRQAWLVVDPPDGKIPALTPEGQRRAARRVRSSFVGGPFDGPEDFSLLDRCISRSVPGSMIPVMYGNTYQIVQAPGFVVITYEIIHEARIIPLDGRAHVGGGIRQHMGDARGHWDGDALVVDTTNFTDAAAYRGSSGSTLHVVERFTRPAADRIAWTATIDDPATWTRPWTLGMTLSRGSAARARLRLPRGQLRPAQHPQRRARRRPLDADILVPQRGMGADEVFHHRDAHGILEHRHRHAPRPQ